MCIIHKRQFVILILVYAKSHQQPLRMGVDTEVFMVIIRLIFCFFVSFSSSLVSAEPLYVIKLQDGSCIGLDDAIPILQYAMPADCGKNFIPGVIKTKETVYPEGTTIEMDLMGIQIQREGLKERITLKVLRKKEVTK